MLQYAFGRAHQLRGHTVTFSLNPDGCHNREDSRLCLPLRSHEVYGLDLLNTKVEFGPRLEFGPWRMENYVYAEVAFDPKWLKIEHPTNVYGLFWSEDYFKEFQDTIRKEFLPAPSLFIPPEAEALAAKMRNSNSVFVHVRRSDWYLSPQGAEEWLLMSMEYYQKAVAKISERFPSPNVFVFSDNVGWCRENMPGWETVTVGGGSPQIDLWLMRQCRHAVIANSSFSWWGAWLGDNQKDRMVVGPRKWWAKAGGAIKDGTQDSLHIMPDRWVCLDS